MKGRSKLGTLPAGAMADVWDVPVTLTLPGPGVYTVYLVDRPGREWEATTETLVEVVWEGDGTVEVRPARGGRKVLPVGAAEGMEFAFGLLAVEEAIWLAAAGTGLLILMAMPIPVILT